MHHVLHRGARLAWALRDAAGEGRGVDLDGVDRWCSLLHIVCDA